MPVPVDYVAKISGANSTQLLQMLSALRAGRKIAGWANGKAFEHIILRGFEIEGATVVWPFNVPARGGGILEQIDGVLYHENLSCLVESKDYQEPINIEAIAKMRNQLQRRPYGTLGLVFSRRGFTEPAKEMARMIFPLQILLWECEEIEECLRNGTLNRALTTKFKFAVEQGVPDYNILAGLR